ncbi:unnamed protein product, partial [Medioppia subpectinata]
GYTPKERQIHKLLTTSSAKIGLIVNERFANLPPKISQPSYHNLIRDLKEAKSGAQLKHLNLDFDWYLMVCKVLIPKNSGGGGNASKSSSDPSVTYVNAEEELFDECADDRFEYSVAKQCDSDVYDWKDDDNLLEPFRRLLLLSSDNWNKAIDRLNDEALPVAPDKASVVSMNKTSAQVHLDSWHHGGCPINKFKIRYRMLGNPSADWIDINHGLHDKQIELNRLNMNSRYQLQITANNEVGFTEAEYTFSTHPESHELNPRAASGHTIRGVANKSANHTINEYSLVIPVAITLLVIVILLVIVALVLRKSSGNGSIYSRKQDSLQMSHMGSCKSGRSTYTNSPYNTPHTCANGGETLPKMNGEGNGGQQFVGLRMGDEPLYATVKRTPRAPRSEAHIYSYPIQGSVSEMVPTNMQLSANCANTSQQLPQTATLIVTVDDRDLEEKLLDELQQQCPLNEHRLSMSHCR